MREKRNERGEIRKEWEIILYTTTTASGDASARDCCCSYLAVRLPPPVPASSSFSPQNLFLFSFLCFPYRHEYGGEMLCRHIYIYISRTPPATIPITTWFSSVLAADAAAAVALPPPSKSQGLLHPQRRNPNVCVRRLYRKGVGWGEKGE